MFYAGVSCDLSYKMMLSWLDVFLRTFPLPFSHLEPMPIHFAWCNLKCTYTVSGNATHVSVEKCLKHSCFTDLSKEETCHFCGRSTGYVLVHLLLARKILNKPICLSQGLGTTSWLTFLKKFPKCWLVSLWLWGVVLDIGSQGVKDWDQLFWVINFHNYENEIKLPTSAIRRYINKTLF